MNNTPNSSSAEGEKTKEKQNNLFKDILSGGILTREIFASHINYFLFVVLLGILYIGNRYHSEFVLRETAIVTKELKDAQAESIVTSTKLLSLKKQSKILENVKKHELGLKPHTKQAKKLIIND
jgi:hypothetical protein